jgi:hypothetical protein
MSYFVAICGAGAGSLPVRRGNLLPAALAQPYFRQFEAELSDITGGPVYLWDDSESDTSDDLVCEACDEVQLQAKQFPDCAFTAIFPQCVETRSSLFAWWPADGGEDFSLSSLPIVRSATDALELFVSQASSGAPIGFALRPNYAFKRTAGREFDVS